MSPNALNSMSDPFHSPFSVLNSEQAKTSASPLEQHQQSSNQTQTTSNSSNEQSYSDRLKASVLRDPPILANFKWQDPNITTVQDLERFASCLLSSTLDHRGRDVSLLVQRLDLRAIDMVEHESLLAVAGQLCPNVEVLLLGYYKTCPSLECLQSILSPTLNGGKLVSLALHGMGSEFEFDQLLDKRSESPMDEDVFWNQTNVADFGMLREVLSRLHILSIDSSIDTKMIKAMMKYVSPSLKRFELMKCAKPNCQISHNTPIQPLGQLLVSCTYLETLNLEGLLLTHDTIEQLFKDSFSNRRMKLREVHLPPIYTSTCLNLLMNACPFLEDLDLNCIPSSLFRDALAIITDQGQSLRNLSLQLLESEALDTIEPNQILELESSLFNFFERRGRSLRGLQAKTWPISDRILRNIARHCAVLDFLSLAPCSSVRSEAAIKDLVGKCKALRHLKLVGVTSPGAAAAAKSAEIEVMNRGLGWREQLHIANVFSESGF
jgi:hypothetical protein